jgi:hypothetical protein
MDVLRRCGSCGGLTSPLDDLGSAACRTCCNDLWIEPPEPGIQRWVTFSDALIAGGIASIDAEGARSAITPRSLLWPWLALASSFPVIGMAMAWLAGVASLAPIVGLAALVIAVPMAIMIARQRSTELVCDGSRGLCEVTHAGRAALRVPFTAIERVRVRVIAPPSYSDSYEVVLDFARAHLRIAQFSNEDDAMMVARRFAEATGASYDHVIERAV